MYVAPKNRITDSEEVIAFIKANPFGIMVAAESNIPIASHIPFGLEEEEGQYFLYGHLSIANELCGALTGATQVLAIFQGPHAYISPSWYEAPNVPTWNYQSVHVYGIPTLLNERELEVHVKKLMEAYESRMPKGRKYEEMTVEYQQKELRGIKGFRMKIENVEAAYKLSQNRNDADHENIVKELKNTGNPVDGYVADAMGRNRKK